MNKYRVMTIIGLLLVIIGGTVISAGWYLFRIFPAQPISLTEQRIYTVIKGTGFNQMCRNLVKDRIIEHCGPLNWYTKWVAELRLIKAGVYLFTPDMSHEQLLQRVTSGVEHQFDFTIVEGERLTDVLNKLAIQPFIHFDIQDPQQLGRDLANPYPSLEGLLYPDTYYYVANSSATQLMERAYQRMVSKLQQAWQKRTPQLPYKTPYQALIMASIIEKETGRDAERPIIASVFVNRLRKNMRLQTDPTVIYGLGESFDGNITRAQLKQKTPYNTYRINGLPPTPIAMPASAAIVAALKPEQTPYLYFVSKNDGSHQFSTTLAEHNRAVRYYQLGIGQLENK